MKKIEIFTDGSCLGNPGPGGCGIILKYHKYKKIYSRGYFYTTNNRMELIAAITAIKMLKEKSAITLTTDSQYLYLGITKWIYNWENKKWKRNKKKSVLNIDLWKKLKKLITKHQITWKWIKGHSGYLENEECNKLANLAAINPTENDLGYQK
ncbi:MAG: ribonuclease HI [Arsenophonus sp.]|nr:MAG: ribonuclease HI [Arsenophonus sp.]